MAKQKATGEKKAKVVKPVKAKTAARAARREKVRAGVIMVSEAIDNQANPGSVAQDITEEELKKYQIIADALIELWDALNGK